MRLLVLISLLLVVACSGGDGPHTAGAASVPVPPSPRAQETTDTARRLVVVTAPDMGVLLFGLGIAGILIVRARR